MVKNLPADRGDVRDVGSVPGSGRSPGGGQGNLLQYSCLETSMDRGLWRATVHGVAKSQARLKRLKHTHRHCYSWGKLNMDSLFRKLHENNIFSMRLYIGEGSYHQREV